MTTIQRPDTVAPHLVTTAPACLAPVNTAVVPGLPRPDRRLAWIGRLCQLVAFLAPARVRSQAFRSRWAGARRAVRADAGMSTAEYAVGTVAAVAFAAVLYKVVQSGAVQSALSSIIQGALGITL